MVKDLDSDEKSKSKNKMSKNILTRIGEKMNFMNMYLRFIQFLVILGIALFFPIFTTASAIYFVFVMLNNYVENNKLDIPRHCYEGLTVKQRFKIMKIVTCKNNLKEAKDQMGDEIDFDNKDMRICINAFSDAIQIKMDDYNDMLDNAANNFSLNADALTQKLLENLESIKKEYVNSIFSPLFDLIEICVEIVDVFLKFINSIIEHIYRIFVTLFMALIYGKNITGIILYIIAGIIIFIMIIIIIIFFALLPVPFFKIPAMIYLAIMIGPLLFAKLVVVILKALSKLMLLKKIEEARPCEEYDNDPDNCKYNNSFKYCEWDEPSQKCYNPLVEHS